MGERGQILIKDTGVYLYTHWGGNELKEMLSKALRKRSRWDDVEYLTRIIFDAMTEDVHGEETGFGIGTEEHSDLNYPLLNVDVKNQKVEEDIINPKTHEKTNVWSFEKFIELRLGEE